MKRCYVEYDLGTPEATATIHNDCIRDRCGIWRDCGYSDTFGMFSNCPHWRDWRGWRDWRDVTSTARNSKSGLYIWVYEDTDKRYKDLLPGSFNGFYVKWSRQYTHIYRILKTSTRQMYKVTVFPRVIDGYFNLAYFGLI